MKLLLGAVSVLALLTAGAQAQVVNFGLGGVFVDLFPVDGGDNTANANSPDHTIVSPDDGLGGFASADDPTPLGGSGSTGFSTAAAGGPMNNAFLSQVGVSNSGFIVQNGDGAEPDNGAVLMQYGNENKGLISQTNDWNDAAAVQVGDGNTIVINQQIDSTFDDTTPGNPDKADHSAAAFQLGEANIGLIDQGGNNNAAAILADGDRNKQFIIQDSNSERDVAQNNAAVASKGDDNKVFINQNSDFRHGGNYDSPTPDTIGFLGTMLDAINHTYGDGLFGDTVGGPLDIVIDGSVADTVGYDPNIVGNGAADEGGPNSAGVAQVGDGNGAAIMQNGAYNQAGIIQTGGETGLDAL